MKPLLSFIGVLVFGDAGITGLRSGDFSGLSSLRHLDLSRSRISVLPERVFSGLSSLSILDLRDNQISAGALSGGVFSSINLRRLIFPAIHYQKKK